MAKLQKEIELEIAHVLFIDIVGYSKLLINEQRRLLELLNRLVRETEQFVMAEGANALIAVPTGDGMALVFYKSPEAPAECAIELARAVNEHPDLKLRMGVHSGPVSGIVDVTGRANIAGAGINLAQRVMDCGDAGHILLSRRVAEDLEHYGHWQDCLHDLGEAEVKHGVRVRVFNLCFEECGNPARPAKLRRRVQKKRTAIWAAAAVFFFAALGASVFLWKGAASKPAARSVATFQGQQRLVSTFPGSHSQATFSPDGNRIAFVNSVDGSRQIWAKDIEQGEPKQITFGEESTASPSWSPDGHEILFTRYSKSKPGIYSISAEGGTPRKVIEGGRNPCWSADGKRMTFERDNAIWTANRDGGDQQRVQGVPSVDLAFIDRQPAFSPDGSLIAFFQVEDGPTGDYWVVPAAGGEARRLSSDTTFGGAPTWTQDGTAVIAPSTRGGSMTLWSFPLDAGAPQPVMGGAGEDTHPVISRDGRKLIYTNTRKRFILTLTDVVDGSTRAVRESRLEMVHPDFSPDGRRLVFFSITETGDMHIFTVGVNGEELMQVTRGKGEANVLPQWSGDGKTIYFYQTEPTHSFRSVPADGGPSTELMPGWRWETHNNARLDPAGERIVYTRMDRGEAAATMIRDIATGQETPLPLPLRHCRWSGDGRSIAGSYLPAGGDWALAEVAVCEVGADSCEKILKGLRPEWSGDDAAIFFHPPAAFRGEEIWRASRSGENPAKIAELKPMNHTNNFYAVADGSIAWVKFEQSPSELWLAER